MDVSCFRPSCHGSWLTPLFLLLGAAALGAGAAASCPALQERMLGAATGTRVPVVHKLANKNGKVPSHAEILAADQRRVQHIHRRVSETTGVARRKQSEVAGSEPSSATSTNQPSSPGSTLDTGFYVVPIGLGTPMKEYEVALDTGSDVTWVQCQPCVGHCYPQKEPLFSPANSSTYAKILCRSLNCSDLDSKVCNRGEYYCHFRVDYVDESYTSGIFAHETLTLAKDTIEGFRFGCSNEKIWGLFGKAAGVLGLARGKTSLMVQAQIKYRGVFAYCLPAEQTGTGFLHIGPGAGAAAVAANASLTPMLTNKGPRYYYVGMTGIKVGGYLLPINSSVFSTAGTILDSGTVITWLPPSAYGPLRSAFARDMEILGYKKAAEVPAHSTIFDTCYDLTGFQGIIKLPTVSLVFQGGVSLDVDATGILYMTNVSRACLAFAANGRDSDLAIIGNTQQKTYSVLHDIGNKVVGFTPGAC